MSAGLARDLRRSRLENSCPECRRCELHQRVNVTGEVGSGVRSWGGVRPPFGWDYRIESERVRLVPGVQSAP